MISESEASFLRFMMKKRMSCEAVISMGIVLLANVPELIDFVTAVNKKTSKR